MNGIVVLNKIEAVIGYTWGFSGWALFATITGFGLAIAALYEYIKKKDKTSFISNIIVSLALIVLAIPSFASAKEITEEQFEIYMPAEVNMADFNERYEIVEQRGLIYTVREIEDTVIEEEH